MSEHITPELGLILATLPDRHPDARRGRAHATRCPECARTLGRAALMLELLEAQADDLEVDPWLKRRIMLAVALEPQRSAPRVVKEARPLGTSQLLLLLGALTSLALAWFDRGARAGLFPARGHFCVMWELLGCALSLMASSLWIERLERPPAPLQLAVIAMGGGLVGQAWLLVRCPTHDALLHSLAYHMTGVMLSGLLGLWHGHRLR